MSSNNVNHTKGKRGKKTNNLKTKKEREWMRTIENGKQEAEDGT